MSEVETEGVPPVVVDLGTVKKKHLKRLRRGEGKLLPQIDEVVEVVRNELGEELEGKELVPLILIYREKKKRRRLLDF